MSGALFLDQGVSGPGHQCRLRASRGRESSKQCTHCSMALLELRDFPATWLKHWKMGGMQSAAGRVKAAKAEDAGEAARKAQVMIDMPSAKQGCSI